MINRTRCLFLKLVALGVSVLFMSPLAEAISRPVKKKPNVIFVLSDDHSVPFLGCYGYPVETPNLDKFAQEGMRFDNMFMGSPQCVPARATLMTGRAASAIRMSRFTSPLPGDVATLPEMLQQQGYYTGTCRRGYHLDGDTKGVYGEIIRKHDLKAFRRHLDFVDVSQDRTKTPSVLNEFLGQVPVGKPFFFWINFNDPHHPWDQNAISEPHDPKEIKVPDYLPDLPGVRADLARHCDEIARLDEEFKWIVDVLKERGIYDDTIVIFMGDNGMAFPHGKGTLYDPGLQVPFIVRWPGVVKPGSSANVMLSGEDFAPTMLEAAGTTKDKTMSGKSFLSLLKGEKYEKREYIFGERGTHGDDHWTDMRHDMPSSAVDYSRCVRSERYKLIYNCTPHHRYSPVDTNGLWYWKQIQQLYKEGGLEEKFAKSYFTYPRPIWQLFDLQKDPAELNNIYDDTQYHDVIKELKYALIENMTLNYDFLPRPAL
jgi:arylsulfatase A-like enzyme